MSLTSGLVLLLVAHAFAAVKFPPRVLPRAPGVLVAKLPAGKPPSTNDNLMMMIPLENIKMPSDPQKLYPEITWSTVRKQELPSNPPETTVRPNGLMRQFVRRRPGGQAMKPMRGFADRRVMYDMDRFSISRLTPYEEEPMPFISLDHPSKRKNVVKEVEFEDIMKEAVHGGLLPSVVSHPKISLPIPVPSVNRRTTSPKLDASEFDEMASASEVVLDAVHSDDGKSMLNDSVGSKGLMPSTASHHPKISLPQVPVQSVNLTRTTPPKLDVSELEEMASASKVVLDVVRGDDGKSMLKDPIGSVLLPDKVDLKTVPAVTINEFAEGHPIVDMPVQSKPAEADATSGKPNVFIVYAKTVTEVPKAVVPAAENMEEFKDEVMLIMRAPVSEEKRNSDKIPSAQKEVDLEKNQAEKSTTNAGTFLTTMPPAGEEKEERKLEMVGRSGITIFEGDLIKELMKEILADQISR